MFKNQKFPIYTLENNDSINILSKLGEGGEGIVYLCKIGNDTEVIKIFNSTYLNTLCIDKVKYLIEHNPKIKELCFPTNLVYENDVIKGYSMPYVEGFSLEDFCTIKFDKKINIFLKNSTIYEKYRNNNEIRHRLAINTVTTIHKLLKLDKYLILDIKPSNIIVTKDLDIVLIDLNNIYIKEFNYKDEKYTDDYKHFITEEYSPVEQYDEDNIKFDKYWDYYCIAILLYRLLLGINPFTGTLKNVVDTDDYSINAIKKQGYLPIYHNNEFLIIPPPHKKFFNLSEYVQKLFIKTLVDGHLNKYERSNFIEWIIGLSNYDLSIKQFKYPELNEINIDQNDEILYKEYIDDKENYYNSVYDYTELEIEQFTLYDSNNIKFDITILERQISYIDSEINKENNSFNMYKFIHIKGLNFNNSKYYTKIVDIIIKLEKFLLSLTNIDLTIDNPNYNYLLLLKTNLIDYISYYKLLINYNNIIDLYNHNCTYMNVNYDEYSKLLALIELNNDLYNIVNNTKIEYINSIILNKDSLLVKIRELQTRLLNINAINKNIYYNEIKSIYNKTLLRLNKNE